MSDDGGGGVRQQIGEILATVREQGRRLDHIQRENHDLRAEIAIMKNDDRNAQQAILLRVTVAENNQKEMIGRLGQLSEDVKPLKDLLLKATGALAALGMTAWGLWEFIKFAAGK